MYSIATSLHREVLACHIATGEGWNRRDRLSATANAVHGLVLLAQPSRGQGSAPTPGAAPSGTAVRGPSAPRHPPPPPGGAGGFELMAWDESMTANEKDMSRSIQWVFRRFGEVYSEREYRQLVKRSMVRAHQGVSSCWTTAWCRPSGGPRAHAPRCTAARPRTRTHPCTESRERVPGSSGAARSVARDATSSSSRPAARRVCTWPGMTPKAAAWPSSLSTSARRVRRTTPTRKTPRRYVRQSNRSSPRSWSTPKHLSTNLCTDLWQSRTSTSKPSTEGRAAAFRHRSRIAPGSYRAAAASASATGTHTEGRAANSLQSVSSRNDRPGSPPARQTLAAPIELREKHPRARIRRSIRIAIPHEFNAEQREALAQQLATAIARHLDTIAAWALHRRERYEDSRNWRVLIGIRTRHLAVDGESHADKMRRLDQPHASTIEITRFKT